MNPTNKHITPPHLAQRFLFWFLKNDLAEEVAGDLEEQFYTQLEEVGARRAKMDYWYQILHYLRPFAIRHFSHLSPFFMFRHNIKISFRTLVRNRGYSFINIGGLALGMTVAMLIGLWIWEEWSFNQHHENYESIAAVMQNQTFNGEVETWWSQPRQTADALKEEYGAHFKHVINSSWPNDMLMEVGESKISKDGLYMEAGAPDMLGLEMIYGSKDGLQDPSSLLIAESVATTLFGAGDPVGETIKIGNAVDMKVAGVYKDIPLNSSFSETEWLASWDFFMDRFNYEPRSGWGNSWFRSFVQIEDQADIDEVSHLIKDVKLNAVASSENANAARFKPQIFLHPMNKWYLQSEFKNGKSIGGNIQYVRLFGVIGLFVLLLACINFVNLSTARSERRAKEVGVRKAIGSRRKQLIGQFFSESFLVTGLAFALALLLVQTLLPSFNTLADKEIVMPWNNPCFWSISLGFCLLTGLLSGIYPALFLSSFHPVKVLKGTFRVGRSAALPRKALVVVQFTVSVALIIGTLVVFRQIQHVKNRPTGYDNNNLVMTFIQTEKMNQQFDAFRHDLLRTGLIEEAALSESRITSTNITNSGLTWPGKDPNMADEFVTMRVTHEFGKVVNWEIKEGRDFSREMATDSMGFVVNEAAVQYMDLENPIGTKIDWGEGEVYHIIGVVKDMITQSPFQPVKQSIFFLDPNRSYCANIKLKPTANMSEAISQIETTFKKYDDVNIFDYTFADERYARKFQGEERIGQLAGWFTLLAIFISCLGVFGLAAFMAERRTKEIGIRKVLGATVPQLWQLLSKEFVYLVLIACVVAAPLAYYYSSNWLLGFEYRTELSWWVFAVAGLGALVITFLTVSFQAVKAALVQPGDSLRAE